MLRPGTRLRQMAIRGRAMAGVPADPLAAAWPTGEYAVWPTGEYVLFPDPNE